MGGSLKSWPVGRAGTSRRLPSWIDSRMPDSDIVVKGAREHNLRDVDLVLPRNQLICFTGVSGSGKSSMAFDTLFAEGQRRYVESLSSYARQFVGQLPKPDVDFIGGLSPAISISQKSAGSNPRSTVGTMTEIYDFLRILFARIGKGTCPKCGSAIQAQSNEEVIERLLTLAAGTEVYLLAPVAQNRKGEQRELIEDLLKQGFTKARVDGRLVRLTAELNLDRRRRHNIEVLIDRVVVRPEQRAQLSECVERALKVGSGNLLALLELEEVEASTVANPAAAFRSSGIFQTEQDEFDLDSDDDDDVEESAEDNNDGPSAVPNASAVGLSTARSPGRSPLELQVDPPQMAGSGVGQTGVESRAGASLDGDGGTIGLSDDEAVQQAAARAKTWPEGWAEGRRLFSVTYSCVACGLGYPLPSPQLFSFNSPQGMCLTCKGMGELFTFDEQLLVWNRSVSFADGCIEILGPLSELSRWQQHIFQGFAETLESERGLAAGYLCDSPWGEIPADLRRLWLFGTGEKPITFTWQGGAKEMKYQGTFAGIVAELHLRYNAAKTTTSKAAFEKCMSNIACPDCQGQRLNPQARHVMLAADVPERPQWQAGLTLSAKPVPGIGTRKLIGIESACRSRSANSVCTNCCGDSCMPTIKPEQGEIPASFADSTVSTRCW